MTLKIAGKKLNTASDCTLGWKVLNANGQLKISLQGSPIMVVGGEKSGLVASS